MFQSLQYVNSHTKHDLRFAKYKEDIDKYLILI
jgi:hypothetical protein